MTAILIALGLGLAGGAGATLALTRPSKATANAVEAAVAPEVEQEVTDRAAIDAEPQAVVCMDGERYSEAGCMLIELGQMQAAEGAQVAVVVDVIANVWASERIADYCATAPGFDKPAECRTFFGVRK